MTREQFIEQHRNELAGMVADAATNRSTGGELSIRLRLWFQRIDAVLGQAFDALQAPPRAEEPRPGPRPTIAINGHTTKKAVT